MLSRLRTRRFPQLLASIVLGALLACGLSGTAVAANPSQSFVVTACVTSADEFHVVGTWSDVRVAAWSFFIESSEGSGGTFQPLAEPVRSGQVSQTSGPTDTDAIQSVTLSLFRNTGPNPVIAASQTLTQPAAGWPAC
jgi:hypothetical protein